MSNRPPASNAWMGWALVACAAPFVLAALAVMAWS